MLQYLKAGFLIFSAFLLQTTLVSHLTVGGARPDLVLITVIFFGFTQGPVAGSVAGFGGGLLLDFLSVGNFGVGVAAKTLVGYLSGLVEKAILTQSRVLLAGAVFLASLLQSTIWAGLLFLLGELVPLVNLLLTEMLPAALYNALLGLILFNPMSRLIGEVLAADRGVPDGRPG